MEEFVNDLDTVKKVQKNPIMALLTSITIIIVAIFVMFLMWGPRKLTYGLTIIAIIYGIILLFFIAKSIIQRRILSKSQSKYSVLILIDSPSAEIFNDTKRKFAKQIDDNIKISGINIGTNIQNYEKVEDCSKMEIPKLLKTTKCFQYIKITINTENIDGITIYYTNLNFKSYINEIRENNAFKEFTIPNFKYTNNNKFETFEDLANGLTIMILTIYTLELLSKGDFETASKAIEETKKYRNETQYIPDAENLFNLLEFLGYITNILLSRKFYNLYSESHNKDYLLDSDIYLERSFYFSKDDYEYNVSKSVSLYLLDRNIKGAKKLLLDKCVLSHKGDSTHLFNRAFLTAANNENEIKVINLYKTAFSQTKKNKFYPSLLLEIIAFIEDETTDEEKSKSRIYLALTILYLEIKDEVNAKKNIDKYLINHSLSIETKNKINELYNDNTIFN